MTNKETKVGDVFNDEKREKLKQFIWGYKQKESEGRILKNKLLGVQFELEDYIQKTENKELSPIYTSLKECVTQFVPNKEKIWDEILFDFIDFYPCQLPQELIDWLDENYEIPKKKNGK